ncbi:gamma carbonic anhydrase family protein [Deinococcus peraridilitoris]|uniref:gamma carbonic anhydrase family protein n=1 Tax=Deinococcus peraridilitoris TaxID=432329 RepID=UPI00030045A0|nr:gamma carbonic anhydrase family protein [Deinococcus peraridilitoris]
MADTAFVAPGAVLVGQVRVAQRASVWFGAVLRGDIEAISIGAGSNVQDGAVLHTDAGYPCVLEENVTVGHRAIVHGAHLARGSLVGMNATMLTGSSLGEGAVLGAGALLAGGQHVPPGMLALGVPAKVVRPVEQTGNAERYAQLAQRYRRELQPVPDVSTQEMEMSPLRLEERP